MKFYFTVFIAASLMTGCASYNYTDAPSTLGVLYSKYAFIGYDEPQNKIEDVGIVTTDGLIKIRSIDGRRESEFRCYKISGLYPGGCYQLHLLPGRHTVTLGFSDDRGGGEKSWSVNDLTKVVDIKKSQIVHFYLIRNGRVWDAVQTDGSSAYSKIVSDFNELEMKK